MQSENIQISLLESREGIFFSYRLKKKLEIEYRIWSKPIGINKSSKNFGQFVVGPYLLDPYAVLYIYEKKICKFADDQKWTQFLEKQISENFLYRVYRDMTEKRRMFLLDGHKFGADFLAYEGNPDNNHAKYLVFCSNSQSEQQISPQQQQMISRLAGICKKVGLLVHTSPQLNYVEIQPSKKRSACKVKRNQIKQ